MATEDDKVNTGALATVVAVGAAGMVGISLAVNALVRHEVGTMGATRDEVGEVAYRSMKQEQLDKLAARADWSDKSKGQVAIPIERAMGLVLDDLKRSPWNASPAPPLDAGVAAAMQTPDAGSDAAATDADAGAPAAGDAGAAPEPPPGTPLSPSAVPPKRLAPTAAAPSPAVPPASPTPPANP